MIEKKLLEKYDAPVPRYTSYPTVPYWENTPSSGAWLHELNQALKTEQETWALYLHIPFCEALCTFCGCNTTITRNHEREHPYVEDIHKEWQLYTQKAPDLLKRRLRQVHLGGGTPTFLSPQSLESLMRPFFDQASINEKDFEASIEVDPRRTTKEHLKALYQMGFRRISMGVQDFNEDVQKLINRIQPFEITQQLTEDARQIGFDSVNFDLIYGLPQQTPERMKRTIELTIKLKPDRIALYSFALVPWIKPAQRIFKLEDLPQGADKRELYEISLESLSAAGYKEIGMDHFALENDSLFQAMEKSQLHRNFMGYTDHRTSILLGLGVSAISEVPTCFHQNEKALAVYERRVRSGELPSLRGHLLDEEDQKRREQILKLMTEWQVRLENPDQEKQVKRVLKEMFDDRLVLIEDFNLRVTEKGRPFLRNICVALDERLLRHKPETQVFSQAL